MYTNRVLVILFIFLIALGLTACVRNLPSPEAVEASPTPGGDQPTAGAGATDDIGEILAFNLTQTAMAQMPQTTPGTPGVPLETPITPIDAVGTQPIVAETPIAPPPTATSGPVQPAPPIIVPAEYTLKGGEFPYCIARRFDIDPGELLRANGLSSTSVFYSGMTLKIPQGAKPFPGVRSLRSHPTTYTVRSGDTINKIACYYGDVAPEGIAAVNGLAQPYDLAAGQTLQIP